MAVASLREANRQSQRSPAEGQVPSAANFLSASSPAFTQGGFKGGSAAQMMSAAQPDMLSLAGDIGSRLTNAILQNRPAAFRFDQRFMDSLSQRVNAIDAMQFSYADMGLSGADWATMNFGNMDSSGVFYKPRYGDSGLPGSRGTGVKGLQQGFSDRLMALIQGARDAGYSIGITDGWRSYASQVSLKKRKPNLAATPGRSNHGWGLAADLSYSSNAARKWMHANAAKYGLRFPMSYEPWHIEPMRIVKQGTAPSAGYGGASSGGSSSSSSSSSSGSSSSSSGTTKKPTPAHINPGMY